VVARSPQDEDTLRELLQRGETNGVQGLKIIDRAEVETKKQSTKHPKEQGSNQEEGGQGGFFGDAGKADCLVFVRCLMVGGLQHQKRKEK